MDLALTQYEAVLAAVEKAGSQSELARICGVSQTAVWKWLQSAKRVPAEFVLRVEVATGVSRHDLRPDIYPREEMTDRFTADRFCGIDRQVGSRGALAAKQPAPPPGTSRAA